MPADTTTFLLAFLGAFAVIAGLLLSLDRRARRLEERLRLLEGASTSPKKDPPAGERRA
ncbi:MAG TPA: hypothetical protein VI796_06265 [Candidatus Thermoplasmatota archaeon]|nr:hypothetical protein [Candidatus Thermoplasmatota archaeon]